VFRTRDSMVRGSLVCDAQVHDVGSGSFAMVAECFGLTLSTGAENLNDVCKEGRSSSAVVTSIDRSSNVGAGLPMSFIERLRWAVEILRNQLHTAV